MATQVAGTSVRTAVVVHAPIEHAFNVFTEGINSWWSPDHHLLGEQFDHMIFEPRVGGHVYDVGADGSECRWSRVLAYDPPNRVVFSWDISTSWQLETDLAKTSAVEVRFIAQGADQTLVELEHRDLDRHGEGWESMRDAVGSPDGWNLDGYAEAAAAGS